MADEVSRRLQRFYEAMREDWEMRNLELGRQFLEDRRRAREENIEENINVGVPNNQPNNNAAHNNQPHNDPSIVSDDESSD